DLGVELPQRVGEEIVGQRPRGACSLELHEDCRRLGMADPDGEVLVPVRRFQEDDRLLADDVEADPIYDHLLHGRRTVILARGYLTQTPHSRACPGSAPCASSSSRSASSPFWVAASSGRKPSCCAAFGSAPASSSMREASRFRAAAALWSGCTCIGFAATTWGSAPASSRACTASGGPKNAARWRAVNPSGVQLRARPGSSARS